MLDLAAVAIGVTITEKAVSSVGKLYRSFAHSARLFVASIRLRRVPIDILTVERRGYDVGCTAAIAVDTPRIYRR